MSEDPQRVQPIVDGKWIHAAKARAACIAQKWPAFVEECAPKAPSFMGRFDHAACRRLASSTYEGPFEVAVQLVPIWAGDNPDDGPSTEWYAAHAMRVDGEPWGPVGFGPHDRDASPSVNRLVMCNARMWRVGLVVESRSYGPDIELLLRRGDYGVSETRIFELLQAHVTEGDELPRPTREVPSFCAWFEPRVSGLAPEIVKAIVDLSITVDEEGNPVRRPR